MNVTSVGLLHLPPEAESRLRQAAEQCFTQVNWIPLDQWPLPTSSQGATLDLVVCSGMVPVDLFAQSEGPQSHPPWPLIILGSTDSRRGVRGIPQADVEAWILAEAIRSVVTEFALLRQIEDLQGDLLTIGRRLNHDLRSPLGCVITTTESLQEVLRETVPAELLQTQFILDSADEALQLVRRVTFLAKATATPPTPSALNMASPFQAAWESLETEALNRRATLQFPEAWPEVLGVSEWLEVIWHNLLKNALQHGGEPPVIAAGWRDLGQSWEFYLEDQGSGVPDTLRPRLFQPFQSLHQPNSVQGFGLAIVRRLCELQGGHCGFRPRQPMGSVFFFVLPQQSPEPGISALTDS